MKQGLSLRVSQHLALTPQLQQSIRLLQLSTLEMAQEVEQMLDENPFLERTEEIAEREAFGLEQVDAPVSAGEQIAEAALPVADALAAPAEYDGPLPDRVSSTSDAPADSGSGDEIESRLDGATPVEESWEGDGTVEMAPDDSEWGGDAPARNSGSGGDDDETASAADLARSPVSLQDHLHEQARCLRLSDEDQAALYFLIESLNDDAYLEDDLAELALGFWRLMHGREVASPGIEELEAAEAQLRMALGWLQHMEPTGVGARNLGECLRLQIEELRNSPEARAALAICHQSMELVAKRDIKRLCALCGIDDETARAALAIIARLEPKPGRRFIDVERNVVVPDVIVTRAGRGFKVILNPDVMPRLRVHDVYANAMRQNRGGRDNGGEAGHAAMQQRLQEARWFIKNIQQRFDTILRVSSAIVERQRNFFMHGELAMRPLVLREIADELGLHESTISRVTTAKYMATPFGTYELKYFFGSSLGTETGGNASSTAVRALLKQFIASEEPKKPLSDNQLSDLLKEQGIECARRTVAKYREALRIAPANLRKSL
ncbi:MAG TPA: RNA polymerase sigma-54 factor [Hydrogenophaga sp.]|uniref:RNA polymerase factor sigma-54 n=1 Tax=Hydrogenophaga sp. TaxID=1904254 RepID=UPI0008C70CFF|nr:RNA polymerase factor sigma-54 [Hydrogenophaga sp.]MBU4183897.1 RNA polymerase factor sigma-54 [Gammaproteobacteria bacterium]OGA74212.1 MAG: RNA polymerase sigma-54 factor [Burkholderiales bacterium GWE1_65_30]OGA89567.1 MAG: RNA polymerase sigma-54 factor [Burkholderiales bacterium GWF1_66_17]OGB28198.1 MAG: RNA polymerase sigma-54 factor [Burkholderiales bacterium RIFCSPLOWO2_02_FULL_66_35]MBU4279614.1 RNA polymerase factor sigma-54 [Gammaproteobacteria bacterium]